MAKFYTRCRRCKQDKPANTFRLCEKCLPVAVTRKRVYTICGECKQEKPASSVRLCKACLSSPERRAKQAEWVRQYRLRKLAGIPSRPITPAGAERVVPPQTQEGERRTREREASRASYEARRMAEDAIARHRKQSREYGQRPEVIEMRRQRTLAQREEVIKHYGGACLCCGEADMKFLTIDHTYRDGAEHRRSEPQSRALYAWLIKYNFPDGGRFRVLCVKCHHAVTFYGACPHDPERIKLEERPASLPESSSTLGD